MRFRCAIPGLVLAGLLICPLAAPAPVAAQEIERIAAVVNDEVVSIFDLIQRMRLVIVSSGLRSSPEVMKSIGPQVLRTLIDERLRLQEASSKNITVTEKELARAIARVERDNNIPPNTLEKHLRGQGIDSETILVQLRSQIAWTKLLRRRQRTALAVTDDEVDEELERLAASQGTEEYLLAEIFLVVESTDQDAIVRENAQRLVQQLRAGANFAAMARQFSVGVTAGQGGGIGWVSRDQLADEVADAVAALAPGEVSDPIRSSGGYMIVLAKNQRKRLSTDMDETQVALKQILFGIAENASPSDVEAQATLAQSIRASVSGCDDMSRAAAEVDPTNSGDIGRLRLKDLPPRLRQVVRDLPIGTVSAPVRTKRGFHLLMVCDRVEPKSALPDREAVRQALIEKRFQALSRRYLRDIRRNAFVDIRI